MSTNRIPNKPDRFDRGGIYICDLPTQTVTERTDGKVHHRDGIEVHGPHPCVVISSDEFNCGQGRGLIVVPTRDGEELNAATFEHVPNAWVRVISRGEALYVQVEQLRCIDRSRCKVKTGELIECDLKMIEAKLKQLIFH